MRTSFCGGLRCAARSEAAAPLDFILPQFEDCTFDQSRFNPQENSNLALANSRIWLAVNRQFRIASITQLASRRTKSGAKPSKANTGEGMTALHHVTVDARPQAVEFDPQRSAVVVVDMQNGFATKGGFLDRAGFDISGAQATVENCRSVVDAARRNRVQIVYLQMGWHVDMHDAGAPHGGMWHKSVAWRFMRERSNHAGSALIRGTWDYDVIDELAPRDGDFLVPKTRLSGFFETNLDSMLRSRGINFLAFVGIATNVCVEATLRDGLYRDYLCLLIEDATNETGPSFVKAATVFNVETILGWVTTTEAYCRGLTQTAAPTTQQLR